MKEGGGISQRTYMHNPWTQTTKQYDNGQRERDSGPGKRRGKEGKMVTSASVNHKNKDKKEKLKR